MTGSMTSTRPRPAPTDERDRVRNRGRPPAIPRSDRIEALTARAYTIPTDQSESDGTFAWDDTTIVIVEVRAAGTTGIGYSYADRAAAVVADHDLQRVLVGRDPFDISAAWS